MPVLAFTPGGYHGHLVTVEVDLRLGIPGTDLVGLASGAVREARERVRAAIRNSGFPYPRERVLINLAPADVPKHGAHLDLGIAVAVLGAAGAPPGPARLLMEGDLLVIGELQLSGLVRPARGVLAAVAEAADRGVRRAVVPLANLAEAQLVRGVEVLGVESLVDCVNAVRQRPGSPLNDAAVPDRALAEGPDYADMACDPVLVRACTVAAAGAHHLLLYGPPGTGKTMAAERLAGILPPLKPSAAMEVTRIHSLAGALSGADVLIRRPPLRMPHHSASREGMLGGGQTLLPGEISLAHNGILLLDEAPEFRRDILQSLREPLESGRVTLVRAGRRYTYPAEFQLVMTMNACPCGNRDVAGRICLCSEAQVAAYRRKLSGALLDRVDLRVSSKLGIDILETGAETSESLRQRVREAATRQERRFGDRRWSRNSRVPAEGVVRLLGGQTRISNLLSSVADRLELSARAVHSVIRVSRTIADIDGKAEVDDDALLEAVQYRRGPDDL